MDVELFHAIMRKRHANIMKQHKPFGVYLFFFTLLLFARRLSPPFTLFPPINNINFSKLMSVDVRIVTNFCMFRCVHINMKIDLFAIHLLLKLIHALIAVFRLSFLLRCFYDMRQFIFTQFSASTGNTVLLVLFMNRNWSSWQTRKKKTSC